MPPLGQNEEKPQGNHDSEIIALFAAPSDWTALTKRDADMVQPCNTPEVTVKNWSSWRRASDKKVTVGIQKQEYDNISKGRSRSTDRSEEKVMIKKWKSYFSYAVVQAGTGHLSSDAALA